MRGGQSMARMNPTITSRKWWGRACGMVVLLLGLGGAEAWAAGRWATLEAIHQLENPRDLARPGAKGELGAYQFRETTWRMHTAVPFARAVERGESDAVAVRHYEWLSRGLRRAGLAATSYNIALAWNGGLGAAVQGRAPSVAREYARRAENLAEDFARRVARR